VNVSVAGNYQNFIFEKCLKFFYMNLPTYIFTKKKPPPPPPQ
jgi:hypothetical protein